MNIDDIYNIFKQIRQLGEFSNTWTVVCELPWKLVRSVLPHRVIPSSGRWRTSGPTTSLPATWTRSSCGGDICSSRRSLWKPRTTRGQPTSLEHCGTTTSRARWRSRAPSKPSCKCPTRPCRSTSEAVRSFRRRSRRWTRWWGEENHRGSPRGFYISPARAPWTMETTMDNILPHLRDNSLSMNRCWLNVSENAVVNSLKSTDDPGIHLDCVCDNSKPQLQERCKVIPCDSLRLMNQRVLKACGMALTAVQHSDLDIVKFMHDSEVQSWCMKRGSKLSSIGRTRKLTIDLPIDKAGQHIL